MCATHDSSSPGHLTHASSLSCMRDVGCSESHVPLRLLICKMGKILLLATVRSDLTMEEEGLCTPTATCACGVGRTERLLKQVSVKPDLNLCWLLFRCVASVMTAGVHRHNKTPPIHVWGQKGHPQESRRPKSLSWLWETLGQVPQFLQLLMPTLPLSGSCE